jgi:Xaa-Pro aminopeptidase
MISRLQKLRTEFQSLGIDAFLVTFQPHLRYLSGFSGSSGLGLISSRSAYLLTDGRYRSQVKQEVNGWNIRITANGFLKEIQHKKLLHAGMRVGFDGNNTAVEFYRHLKKMFPKIKFLPKVGVIEKIAAVKDADEIKKIKQAIAITDQTFSAILEIIQPGMTELDVAAEISYQQRKRGAEADAFEAIVASGERSALPHGRATSKKLQRGELVTLDFGCISQGYHSDLTRTIVLGKPNTEAKKIYHIVLEAQKKAIAAAKSNMKTKDLDAVAREYIKQSGYGKYFQHSLGHGIGLQIHESPRISASSKEILESGNVVTIEPGVYIPKFCGVRIEDDIVITNGGCEVLTHSPKHLIVV